MTSFLLAELEHGDFQSVLSVLKSQASAPPAPTPTPTPAPCSPPGGADASPPAPAGNPQKSAAVGISAAAASDCYVDATLASFLMRGGTLLGFLDQVRVDSPFLSPI